MTWVLVIYFFAITGETTHTVKGQPMERHECFSALRIAEKSVPADGRLHFRCARHVPMSTEEWMKSGRAANEVSP